VEVARQIDGLRLSTFFHKDREMPVVAGPNWDYDLGFGNCEYLDGWKIEGWYSHNGGGLLPFIWHSLLSDPLFVSQLVESYRELRKTAFSDRLFQHLIDFSATVLQEDAAVDRNFIVWPILGEYVWPNPRPIPKDYPAEIAYLSTWIQKRLQWMDANIETIKMNV